MRWVVALGAAAGIAGVWWVVVMLWPKRRSATFVEDNPSEQALSAFAARCVGATSIEQVLGFAVEAVKKAFGAPRVALLRPVEGVWTATTDGQEATVLVPTTHAVFPWFAHNPVVAGTDRGAARRVRPMKQPLAALRKQIGVDAIVPVVCSAQTVGAIGIALARKASEFDADLLDQLGSMLGAAAAAIALDVNSAPQLTAKKETDVATAFEVALVPPIAEGMSRNIMWAGYFKRAGDAGSDFWDAFDMGNGRVIVVVGDVIGRGLGPSLLGVVGKACCDAIYSGQAEWDAAALLGILNRALSRKVRPIQMTCIVLLFDGAAGVMQYANAGIPTPYVVRGNDGRLGMLKTAGVSLGQGATKYETTKRPLAPGDLFYFYTDGVVDAKSPQGIPFSDRRLQKTIVDAGNPDPRIARDRAVSALQAHRGETPLIDDEVLVLVRVADVAREA